MLIFLVSWFSTMVVVSISMVIMVHFKSDIQTHHESLQICGTQKQPSDKQINWFGINKN